MGAMGMSAGGCDLVFPYEEAPPLQVSLDASLDHHTSRDYLAIRDFQDLDGQTVTADSGEKPDSDSQPADATVTQCNSETEKYDAVDVGTDINIYQICNENQLADLYNNAQNHQGSSFFVMLQQSIPLSLSYQTKLSSGGGSFQGTFDGQGFEISGLVQPLFNTITDTAVIYDLSLGGVRINTSSSDLVGALAGTNNGTLRNIQVHGRVSGYENVGGIVGVNNGTIEDCVTVGIIQGVDNVGGLVGFNEVNAELLRSYSHAQVGVSLVQGNKGKGGAVGTNAGTISESFATGKVSGFVLLQWFYMASRSRFLQHPG